MGHAREPLALVVFIDALGWRIAGEQDFLSDVCPARYPLETIFGYSSTCHPTIYTGCLPREHGHFSFFYYDPVHSPFRYYRPLGWLPDKLINRGRVRHWLSKLCAKAHGYTGYFELYNMPFDRLNLFNYSEKRDIYRPGGINGGMPTIFDYLRGEGIPASVSNWRLSDEERLARLESELEGGGVRFAYLYLGALDSIMHGRGTHAAETDARIKVYGDWLRRLLGRAERRYGDIRLHVFSDHGMADIRGVLDLMGRIEGLGLAFGRDYAAVYDSTMARFWFLNERSRGPIESCLRETSGGRMLTDAELAAWGCDFPGRQYGELFYLLDAGVLLCPSFMGNKPLAGMHGYDPADVDSTAALLATSAPAGVPPRLDGLYGLLRSEAERVS